MPFRSRKSLSAIISEPQGLSFQRFQSFQCGAAKTNGLGSGDS